MPGLERKLHPLGSGTGNTKVQIDRQIAVIAPISLDLQPQRCCEFNQWDARNATS
jgi:hypothetical protein